MRHFCSLSCCQKRRTVHPAARKDESVSMSLTLLASILARQNAPFRFGQVPCRGQPCQKQPSTKMASLRVGKAMSMVRRGLPQTG